MTTVIVGEITQLLTQWARGQITTDEYVHHHRGAVHRAIVSWQDSESLRPYIPRLLYYCLQDAIQENARSIVDLTHQRFVGNIGVDEYAHDLRLEFAVLDRRNSVPWAYGIRCRRGDALNHFAAIVDPNTPIDPHPEGSHTRRFRTTAKDQRYALVELYRNTGEGTPTTAPTSVPLMMTRFGLPRNLDKGTEVLVEIERFNQTGLRLILEIPEHGYRDSVEARQGFSDLTEHLEADQSLAELLDESEGGQILRGLVDAFIHFLGKFSDSLSETYRERLEGRLQQAYAVLEERRGDEAPKAALELLIDSLRESYGPSIVFVAETVLDATAAPSDVTEEFDSLAAELLQLYDEAQRAVALLQDLPEREERLGYIKDRLWNLVGDWYTKWKRDMADRAEDIRRVEIESLFDLLRAIYDPAIIDQVVDRPLEWSRLRRAYRLETAFLASDHFLRIPESSQEILKRHAQAAEDLLIRREQELKELSLAMTSELLTEVEQGPDDRLPPEGVEQSELREQARRLADEIIERLAKPDAAPPTEASMLLEPIDEDENQVS